MTALVIGDLNVDMEILLPSPEVAGVHANPPPKLTGGGSAANTAAALAGLGVDCRFVGTVGDDAFGRFARSELAATGVDTRSVGVTGDASTVVVMVVVPPDGDRLIYVWPPAGGAHSALTSDRAVAAVEGASWVHVSGICLRLTPARGALLEAMAAARSSGTPVSFDLNLRLENWGWDEGFRDVVLAAVEQADVVVGSASDEVTALAGVGDPVDAAAELAGEGRLVIARLGSEGAVAVSSDGVVRVPGHSVEVVDTVGAGDAFDAGFIAARLDGAGVEDSLRWANAVAALTVTGRGARSTPTRSATAELLARD